MTLIGVEGIPRPMVESAPDRSAKALVAFAEQWFKIKEGWFGTKGDRKPESTLRKHMVRQYLRHNYTLSLNEIGAITCKVDHSTVIHSLAKHSDGMLFDSSYKRKFNAFSAAARAEGYREATL